MFFDIGNNQVTTSMMATPAANLSAVRKYKTKPK
jgi:hypothetical protein